MEIKQRIFLMFWNSRHPKILLKITVVFKLLRDNKAKTTN